MTLFAFSVVFNMKMIYIFCFTVISRSKFGIFYPLATNWRRIPTLNFKDLFYFVLLHYEHKDTTVFATCCWLTWFARNILRYEGTFFSGHLLYLKHFILLRNPQIFKLPLFSYSVRPRSSF